MNERINAPAPEISGELRKLLDGSLPVEDFIASIVHEAIQPLAAIRVLSAALRTNPAIGDDQRVGMLEDIENQAQFLQDLARWMLQPFARSAVKVDELVSDVCLRARPLAPEHTIESDLTGGDAEVECEVVRIEASIRNLIRNAAEHAPPLSTITVRAEIDGEFAVITVSDKGSGIPEPEWTRIFERYAQIGDGADSPGLGLFIVRSSAINHGGDARVASSGPGGTEIEMTLRLSHD